MGVKSAYEQLKGAVEGSQMAQSERNAGGSCVLESQPPSNSGAGLRDRIKDKTSNFSWQLLAATETHMTAGRLQDFYPH